MLRTHKTPQRFPVCQGSQTRTPKPLQKNGQRLRRTQNVGKIKNSVLGRMEGKQGLLPRGGKYWNWILGDQEFPQQNHSWGKGTPGRENARIGPATYCMYPNVLIHSFHSENSDAPREASARPEAWAQVAAIRTGNHRQGPTRLGGSLRF